MTRSAACVHTIQPPTTRRLHLQPTQGKLTSHPAKGRRLSQRLKYAVGQQTHNPYQYTTTRQPQPLDPECIIQPVSYEYFYLDMNNAKATSTIMTTTYIQHIQLVWFMRLLFRQVLFTSLLFSRYQLCLGNELCRTWMGCTCIWSCAANQAHRHSSSTNISTAISNTFSTAGIKYITPFTARTPVAHKSKRFAFQRCRPIEFREILLIKDKL